MMLGAYYRENHYHPLMALRSSFSILIQVPFFIAAYNFLSHLESLKGVSFLFIHDFGNPDAVFKIGSFSINVLPILMTLINVISGAIYSRGHRIGEKVQIYACAMVFLVLLYNSPAGLVVYWTMNNILSLVKNIFYKIKNPKKVLYIILCAFSAFLVVFGIAIKIKIVIKIGLIFAGLIFPVVPFLVRQWGRFVDFIYPDEEKSALKYFSLFIFAAITLTFLAGLAIPSMLIESEPVQYCFIENYTSPFVFLRNVFYQSFGLFILWPTCLFFLFSQKAKKGFAIIYPVAAILGIINCFLFSENYGPISPELYFMTQQTFMPSITKLILNIVLMAVSFIIVLVVIKKKYKIFNCCALALILSLFAIGIKNSILINTAYKKMTPPVAKNKVEPMYHLSKTGKNVIVIMQDRLFMPYIDDIFKAKPEFLEQFDGFTFYNNTVSMGSLTMVGSVGIFGGYDFTPYEINKRTDETLQSKHNKALLTMPILFHDAGFDVYISGLPYENFLEYPITDMYKDYPYINRQETRGMYSDLWYKEHGVEKKQYLASLIKRNFMWFSIFKMIPPITRRYFYHGEWWLSYSEYDDGFARFLDNYSELEYLPQLVAVDAEKDSFILIDNETTHEPIVMQAPDFKPEKVVTDFGENPLNKIEHYCTAFAVFNEYVKFFNYLKSEGVYDNTRIIIVSDHGTWPEVEEFKDHPESIKQQNYVAAFLVKDFYASGNIKTNSNFMTNADTPYLATKNIIENAKNPFTGNSLQVENKAEYVKISSAPAQSTRIRNETKYSIKNNEWITVFDDIYNPRNWKRLK